MKKIISILLVVAFALSLSLTAFAAEVKTFTFELSTDVTTVTAGESVIVTVDATGAFADVANIQIGVIYDTENFSTVTSGRAPWGFDKTWYDSLKDSTENLGYIATPGFGENPAGQINVNFISTDGYYIDDGGALYTGTQTTTVAKIKFTAKNDTTITSETFKISDKKSDLVVDTEDGTTHNCVIAGGSEEEPEEPTEDKWGKDETATVGTVTFPTTLVDGAVTETATSGARTQIAVFGKNATAKTLADGDYWVQFNENKYLGKASTEAVTMWAIVIVDTTGEKMEADRTYSYTAGCGDQQWTGEVTVAQIAE